MSTPDVKVIGSGGSVEADSVGIFYTHYTYNHTSRCYWSSVSLKSRDVISYEDSSIGNAAMSLTSFFFYLISQRRSLVHSFRKTHSFRSLCSIRSLRSLISLSSLNLTRIAPFVHKYRFHCSKM